MDQKQMEGFDAISGKEGRAYAKVNGNNEEMFYLKNIEASAEKAKSAFSPVGSRVKKHKTTGLEITGSATLYYFTPTFRKLLEEYKETGVDPYFDVVVDNTDPATSAGSQSVLLQGVNFDAVLLAKLDGDSDDALEEDMDFTAEDYKYLKHFNKA